MPEIINESVSVDLVSSSTGKTPYPCVISWRGRRYVIRKVGLHHVVREGRTMLHIFSVTDGSTFFRLKFDTETLRWKLMEVDGEF